VSGKNFEQKNCSPLRDGGASNNLDASTLSPKQGARRDAHLPRDIARLMWEMKMRKTIVTLFGSVLIAASAAQMAAAAQPHRSHKADRAPVMTHEQFRDSNAAWPAAQPDWSR
jgi:hypothetical protein